MSSFHVSIKKNQLRYYLECIASFLLTALKFIFSPQLYYDVPWCGFLYIHLICGPWHIWNLLIFYFLHVLKNFSHYLYKYYLSSIFSLFFFCDSNCIHIRSFYCVLTVSYFMLFFFSFISTCALIWIFFIHLSFEFSNPFCFVKSAVHMSEWIFSFINCISQF